MCILLIQPAYPWGTHIYPPNGLMSLGARLMAAGHTVRLADENIEGRKNPLVDRPEMVGVGILGAPYAPMAIRTAMRLRKLGYSDTIVFGGEFVNRLTPEERAVLFDSVGPWACTFPFAIPSAEETSMSPMLEQLPERILAAYFRNEFCLYTSTGCAFNCHFCAAEKGTKERFRTAEVWHDETRTIARLVKRYAGVIPSYEIYLSSLDVAQTPKKMEEMLRIAHENFAREGVRLRVRGLATAKCVVRAVEQDENVFDRWHSYGLTCLGIGVDGADPEVWRREGKLHNTESDVAAAFAALQSANILPEALMVVGFADDNLRALALGAIACREYTHAGIRGRPFLGKKLAPGNEGWKCDPSAVDELLRNPEKLLDLDFGAFGGNITHPNWKQRAVANLSYAASVAYLKLFSPFGCPTQPLLPTQSIPRPLRPFARLWNRALPGDK
ncbi:MAG: radical SAM protein [Patescibacteria group bacterium]